MANPPPPWTETHKKLKKNSHQNPPKIKPITTGRHRKSNPKPTRNSHTTMRHTTLISPCHAHTDLHVVPTPTSNPAPVACLKEEDSDVREGVTMNTGIESEKRERERTEWHARRYPRRPPTQLRWRV